MAETNIHQEIVNKTVGFSFRLVVEREIRKVTDAKYPDKTVSKAELGGHSASYEEARANLLDANTTIQDLLDGKPKEEVELAVEEPEVAEDENPSE